MKADVIKILHEELKKNGKKGGNTTKKRYGSDHYVTISKKGVRARRKKTK